MPRASARGGEREAWRKGARLGSPAHRRPHPRGGESRSPPDGRLRHTRDEPPHLAAPEESRGWTPRGSPPLGRPPDAGQQALGRRARPDRGDLCQSRICKSSTQPDRAPAGRPRHLHRIGIQHLQGVARARAEPSPWPRPTGGSLQPACQLRGEGALPGLELGVRRGPAPPGSNCPVDSSKRRSRGFQGRSRGPSSISTSSSTSSAASPPGLASLETTHRAVSSGQAGPLCKRRLGGPRARGLGLRRTGPETCGPVREVPDQPARTPRRQSYGQRQSANGLIGRRIDSLLGWCWLALRHDLTLMPIDLMRVLPLICRSSGAPAGEALPRRCTVTREGRDHPVS